MITMIETIMLPLIMVNKGKNNDDGQRANNTGSDTNSDNIYIN